MKIMLDKEETISFEYTTLNCGKIVLDISDKQLSNIMTSIYAGIGADEILSCFDYKELLELKTELDDLINSIQESDMATKQRF